MNVDFFNECKLIYIDTLSDMTLLCKLNNKIILSKSEEIYKKCISRGLVHIFVINEIPKVDVIITNENSFNKSDCPIIYENGLKKWCPTCHKIDKVNDVIGRFCSENCMKMKIGFMKNFKPDIGFYDILNKQKEKKIVIEFDKSLSNSLKAQRRDKNNSEKFQRSMEKDATRLDFAFKREKYKKEMRQPSLRKNIVEKGTDVKLDHNFTKICKGITKKGEKCTNRALGSSDFCGIFSHSTG